MAMVDVGSRIKSSATLIGEEEGDHDDDRDTLNTASKQFLCRIIEKWTRRTVRIIPSWMRKSPDTAMDALSRWSRRAAPLTVRLPLMLREALDSEADAPENGNELRGHVDHAKLIEQQKERTRADSVVGIRALSADNIDRSTRGRRGRRQRRRWGSRRRRRWRADIYRDEISTSHAMSIGGRRRYRHRRWCNS